MTPAEHLALEAHMPALAAQRRLEEYERTGVLCGPDEYRRLQLLATGDEDLADDLAAEYAALWMERRGNQVSAEGDEP